jgi:hypothetical protein
MVKLIVILTARGGDQTARGADEAALTVHGADEAAFKARDVDKAAWTAHGADEAACTVHVVDDFARVKWRGQHSITASFAYDNSGTWTRR